MRSTQEWIGKTDDQRVPDYVRLRIFIKRDGRCHITGRKIASGDKWDLEHVIALCNGGQHRESNMAPALVAPHKIKTRADRDEKKRTDSLRRRHIGIKKPRTITAWRKFNGTKVYASRER